MHMTNFFLSVGKPAIFAPPKTPSFGTESYLIGNPYQNKIVWENKCKSTLKTALPTFGTGSYLIGKPYQN